MYNMHPLHKEVKRVPRSGPSEQCIGTVSFYYKRKQAELFYFHEWYQQIRTYN